LLLDLTRRRGLDVLRTVHVTAGKLPHPTVDDEPMPPHQQNLALVVDHQRHRGRRHGHDVLREGHPVRESDVDRGQSDVPVLVHQLVAVDPPLRTHTGTVGHNKALGREGIDTTQTDWSRYRWSQGVLSRTHHSASRTVIRKASDNLTRNNPLKDERSPTGFPGAEPVRLRRRALPCPTSPASGVRFPISIKGVAIRDGRGCCCATSVTSGSHPAAGSSL